MKFSDIRWGAGILLVALAGCADSSLTTRHSVAAYAPVDAQGNPNQSVVTRDSVKRRPFRMPENFTSTAWKQMVIGVNPRTNVYASSSSLFSNDDLRYMGSRLQSELAKLKRFSIQDIEDADHAVLEELSDVGGGTACGALQATVHYPCRPVEHETEFLFGTDRDLL